MANSDRGIAPEARATWLSLYAGLRRVDPALAAGIEQLALVERIDGELLSLAALRAHGPVARVMAPVGTAADPSWVREAEGVGAALEGLFGAPTSDRTAELLAWRASTGSAAAPIGREHREQAPDVAKLLSRWTAERLLPGGG